MTIARGAGVDLLGRDLRARRILIQPAEPTSPSPQDETSLNDRPKRERRMDAVGEAIEAYFGEPMQVAGRQRRTAFGRRGDADR